ncbi:MAG: O-antigen ligase family protein, partial [bacterium]|nr:O-antigen ligase family protein [bacterium]
TTLALTFSRAGIAASALAVLSVAWCERAHARRVLVPYLVGLAVGIAADAGWIAAARTLPLLRARDVHGDYAGGVGHRSELWRAAIFFFRHHPLLGIGAGNYERELADAGLVGVRTHANSWYLQALAEGGIVLFAATLGWIATAIAMLRARLHVSPWALGAFAATLALVAHQFVDYLVFYPKVAEPWILLIALGLAAPPAD